MYAYELMQVLRDQYPEAGLGGFFRRLERVVERVWSYRNWRYAQKTGVLTPYFETEGMTVIHGNVNCGSASGAWLPEHVGGTIHVTSEDDPEGYEHTIVAVTDPTLITLDSAWAGASSTAGATGKTLQVRYGLPSDLLVLHGVWRGADVDLQRVRALSNPGAYTVDPGYGGEPRVCFGFVPELDVSYPIVYKRRWVTASAPGDLIDVWGPLEAAVESGMLFAMLQASTPRDEAGIVRWQALRSDAQRQYQEALQRAAVQDGRLDPVRVVNACQAEFVGMMS